ncbi:MAG TPA: cardiolipin synthase ClsB [Rhodocyclaceae bacterium]|nr:cardiolipin synthase ClsB [Rhodocyclaceae bacterium]
METVFLPGNRIQLLETGNEYFPALIDAIEAAVTEVHLEAYIFEDDETGRSIVAAMANAVSRGVSVHVLVDGFGSHGFMQKLGAKLAASGVDVLIYGPNVSPLTLSRHRLRRLHRKLVTIDRRIAFVGGINVINDTDASGLLPPRYDYALRIEGPLLAPIYASMRHLWQLVSWTRFRHRFVKARRHPAVTSVCGEIAAAFLIRDNLRHRRDIEEAYLDAIGSARSEILLANAYFLPGRRFRHALMDASQRGVKVSVLLQGQADYLLLHHATQALYGALLSAGVRIFEYRKSFLHAKVAVIDGHWATVGSSNIDPFSLLLAREANVVVNNADFAGSLLASLRRATLLGAAEVRREDWGRKSLVIRMVNWLAYTAVRLMIGISGSGSNRQT